jgi:hypothetical protein
MKCRSCGEPVSKSHLATCPNRAHFGVKAKPDKADKK